MNLAAGQNRESKGLYSIGNGQLCVYASGMDIEQIFGPPLSTPSYMKVCWEKREDLRIDTERESGTDIWKHTLFDSQGKEAGEILDFVVSHCPCFIRICRLRCQLRFQLNLENGWQVIHNKERYPDKNISGGFLAYADAGISIYPQASYPSVHELSHQFLVKGPVKFESDTTLVMEAGESVWYSVGGNDYPECIENTEKIIHQKAEDLLEETTKTWKSFIQNREDFESVLPGHFPMRENLLGIIDDVSILIRTQQSKEGAVIAGHNFHMAYVRDQLGVSRGLIKLGFLEEAKAILQFYLDIFTQYGAVHNAQTIGHSHYFHIHENDNVEITGYLIIQAFDYLEASGDKEFVRLLTPMLTWAWQSQTSELHENMLPFNGDETYVAGGIMPRHLLGYGSAEATFLFLAAGERFLPYMFQEKFWNREQYLEQLVLYDRVRKQYRSNFMLDGRLTVNRAYQNPLIKKRFVHGVCTECLSYGWVENNKWNQYVCMKCYSREKEPSVPEKAIQEIPSVYLMPLFIGSTLFHPNELKVMIEKVAQNPLPRKVLGYDAGILLDNLTSIDAPSAESYYRKLIDSADPRGGWSEFYRRGVPAGTRYRPWESGINVYALLQYVEKQKENKDSSIVQSKE